MTKIVIAFFVFVAAACTAMAVMSQRPSPAAQNRSPVMDRIASRIKAREPEWEIKRRASTGRSHFDRWSSGSEVVMITVSELGSPAEAAALMRQSADSVTSGSHKILKGYGDEAEMWEGYNDRGATAIHLRLGSTLVFVNADSVGTAKRFARHVIDGLEDNGPTQ